MNAAQKAPFATYLDAVIRQRPRLSASCLARLAAHGSILLHLPGAVVILAPWFSCNRALNMLAYRMVAPAIVESGCILVSNADLRIRIGRSLDFEYNFALFFLAPAAR